MSALPILDITKDSYKICTDNFNSVLTKVGDRPFALISINGATRTGKSYALSYFIRYLTFKTGCGKFSESTNLWIQFIHAPELVAKSGRMRTTLGIDLWSEPFILKDPVDGRDVAVLLMDCQGLFDDLTTARQNAIIFSLSSLCSSMSVFNLMKNVDESILQQIQFFSGYAHLISQEKEDKDEQNSFQRLIFLIRDFGFQDFDYGYHGNVDSPKGGKNFYKDVFNLSAAGVERPPENHVTREEILRSYKEVSCFLMPHPGPLFTRDQSKAPHPDFDKYLKDFVELVISPENLETKKIGGQEITGNDFKKFVEEWAKLCENSVDHFPEVQTIAESTAAIQNTLALDKAAAHYEKEMSSFLNAHPRGLSDAEFLKLHERLKSESLALFNSIQKIKGETTAEKYGKSLEEQVKKLYEGGLKTNSELVSKAAKEDELKKEKTNLSNVQSNLSGLEIQTQLDKQQHEKAAAELQRKINTNATANTVESKQWQDRLTEMNNNYQRLSREAEETKRILTLQLADAQARLQQSQQRPL